MPTDKPRLNSTLTREIERGAIHLRAQGIDNSRIVSEGVVALVMMDQATRDRVKQFTTLLDEGILRWDRFVELIRQNQKSQERALVGLMESMATRAIAAQSEPRTKQDRGRSAGSS